MSESIYAPRPENLRMKGATHVSSDLYDICNRIREVDPSLFIVYHPDHQTHPYVVMEHCRDGEDRIVKRYATLDARVLEDLRYMLAVPFDERWKRIAAEVDAANEKIGKMDEEKMDRFMWEFDRAARRSNMYDPVWLKNMPLTGKRS
jgi:hypothetical protein